MFKPIVKWISDILENIHVCILTGWEISTDFWLLYTKWYIVWIWL